jgi:phosphoribosylamine--glycine ligase
MRVLVIGSGGREHALCWAIAASPLLTKLWCAPGNPGIAQVAECVPIGVMDFSALVAFAQDNEIDLVVPGPEAPLVAGIADAMEAASIPCIGPSRQAAQLEGSKAFTKELCDAAGIPTAQWERFDDAEAARAFVRRRGAPLVVKGDGLAAGKAVVVAATDDEAIAAIDAMMDARVFGEAGASVVIEECLQGEEVSLFALCDGTTALPFGAAQDHKRVGEGETGPNTGGMGGDAVDQGGAGAVALTGMADHRAAAFAVAAGERRAHIIRMPRCEAQAEDVENEIVGHGAQSGRQPLRAQTGDRLGESPGDGRRLLSRHGRHAQIRCRNTRGISS